jgi:hypothetical protein
LTTQYHQVEKYTATYIGVGEFKLREKLRKKLRERKKERRGE